MEKLKLLSLNNLYKVYGEKEALKEVTLEFEKGKIYGLVGTNGAGKTTLLKAISNIIPIDSGEIIYKNKPVAYCEYEHLKDFGTLIESPSFYDGLTVYDNIKLHCDYMGYYDYNEINRLLELFDLANYKSKKVKILSIGQKQRLGIIRSLITKPQLLILDEPINGLDPIAINKFIDAILYLKRKIGTTIIIASHLLNELENLIDNIIVISDGEIIESTSIENLSEEKKKYIDLKVDNLNLATAILEEKFGIENYKVLHNERIRIYNSIDIKSISKELILSDILISEVMENSRDLSEYIISIMEGDNNCD